MGSLQRQPQTGHRGWNEAQCLREFCGSAGHGMCHPERFGNLENGFARTRHTSQQWAGKNQRRAAVGWYTSGARAVRWQIAPAAGALQNNFQKAKTAKSQLSRQVARRELASPFHRKWPRTAPMQCTEPWCPRIGKHQRGKYLWSGWREISRPLLQQGSTTDSEKQDDFSDSSFTCLPCNNLRSGSQSRPRHLKSLS